MPMIMDPGEILREYRTAAKKDKQITVLADLNCVKPMDIALLLRDLGAEFSENWKKRLARHDGAKRTAEPSAQEKPAKPEAKAVAGMEAQPLTVGTLCRLLAGVPAVATVEIVGESGPATSALFLTRADEKEVTYVVIIQREAQDGQE